MKDRYEPIDTLTSFQHQASHYKRISNPKKMIQFDSIDINSRNKNYSSYLDSKYEKQKKQEIKKENHRIFKDFIQMSQKKGVLQRAEFDSNNILQSKNRKVSLVNPYKAREKHQKILRQNQILKQKLKTLKPSVGERKQWTRHESLNKQMNKKLRNKSPFSKQVFNTQNFFKAVMDGKQNKNKNMNNLGHFYQTLKVGKAYQDHLRQSIEQSLHTEKQNTQVDTGRAKTQKKRRNYKKVKPKTSHSSLVAKEISHNNQEVQP